MIASEPLPHFVDDLLGYLHETHPTHATLDGVHTHDDLLEDVSRQGVDAETHALSGYLRRLDEINRDGLTAIERLEHRMLTANLQARMLELEAVRTWERNPQHYSDLLASSLAGQTLFSHAPSSERARRVLSKLRQTPRLIQAAPDNITEPPGIYVTVGREQLEELATFLERQALITLPPVESITVAPTPDFYRWSFASMWTPGPFETKPAGAYYYLTDVDRTWPSERQDEHLRDYNYPTLWSISIHEVYPGHFLHYQHLRRVESKARKSILFAPASFVEGWAHYCEQMMIEAGFGRQDYGIRLGQLAEALIRLVRFIVCIRLHAEDMSVEQGVRYFREEAFIEEISARH